MVRLIVEDVVLMKRDEIAMHVRFRGGATKSFTLPIPLNAPMMRKTDAEVVSEIDRLLEDHTEMEIAAMLNKQGRISGTGKPFTLMMVTNIRRHYRLKERFARLRQRGLFTIDEIAERFGIAPSVVKDWRHKGLLVAHRYNDKDQYLYEAPADDLPGKFKKKRPYMVAKANQAAPAKGVQYEA